MTGPTALQTAAEPLKACSVCHFEKPASAFSFAGKNAAGEHLRASRCKGCIATLKRGEEPTRNPAWSPPEPEAKLRKCRGCVRLPLDAFDRTEAGTLRTLCRECAAAEAARPKAKPPKKKVLTAHETAPIPDGDAQHVVSWGCPAANDGRGGMEKLAVKVKPPSKANVRVECGCGDIHFVSCMARPRREGEEVTEVDRFTLAATGAEDDPAELAPEPA